MVGSLLVAALAVCVLPGVADAKKKRDKVGVMSYNLYLGSDLGPATAAAQASKIDAFSDEVGFVQSDVLANNFNLRATQISEDIKKRKVDLIGLQEAALWKQQAPTDGGAPSAGNPNAIRAVSSLVDYVDILLRELNKKAKTNKQCKKQDIPKRKCYRGYETVVVSNEADLEFPGDFDGNPGPDGKTCDFSSGACPNPYPSGGGGGGSDSWLWGNDDTGASFQQPPAAQCSDGIDNDGDGLVDWGPVPGTNETSGPSPPGLPAGQPAGGPWDCNTRLDNAEGRSSVDDPFPLGGPQGAPQDTNMDNHIYTGDAGAAPGGLPDALGNGLDPDGISDCPDNNPEPGPAVGADPDGGGPAPPWDAPNFDGSTVNVCLFHGIDGDLSLTMRDVILKRKGAGVKADGESAGNFASRLSLPIFGGTSSVNFTRGWTAVDANVRGKRFRFVNTHLESESNGSIREDQAAELVAPGGPANAPATVLVGDLNSDPNRAPANLPDGDGGSNIAINRLLSAGFATLATQSATGGHGELLSDQSDGLGEGQIDHVLTNDPGGIVSLRSEVIDTFANGLWSSDHGGVYVKIKGKKK